MQDIIGKVLHRLIDLDPAILKRIETTMEQEDIVMGYKVSGTTIQIR